MNSTTPEQKAEELGRKAEESAALPAEEMPFNLEGETLPEMTSEEWESYCHAFKEENRRKIREQHANENSTAPFNR